MEAKKITWLKYFVIFFIGCFTINAHAEFNPSQGVTAITTQAPPTQTSIQLKQKTPKDLSSLSGKASLIGLRTSLISPKGNISDTTPTYIWSAVEKASWYFLWVNDSKENKIKKWYTAAQAG